MPVHVRSPNNSPTFPVEAATAWAEVTGGFTLSSTTTILPDHPVLSVNGDMKRPRNTVISPLRRVLDKPMGPPASRQDHSGLRVVPR